MDDVQRLIADGEKQCASIVRRLDAATITVRSPQDIATVVCNGRGDIVRLVLRPGAERRYNAARLSAAITTALQGADRAVDTLRDRAFGQVMVNGDTVAHWRSYPSNPALLVAEAFQETVEETTNE
jgi:DNA-binding protein YbaB